MKPLTRTLACIVLFASLASRDSDARQEASPQQDPSVEVRVTFAPNEWSGRDYANGPGVTELCASTRATLEARFWWAKIDVLDDLFAGIYEYRIRGRSALSELQLGLLGTAQPELRLLLTPKPGKYAADVDLEAGTKRAEFYLTSPRRDLAAFNALDSVGGGPGKGISFAWQTLSAQQRQIVPLLEVPPSPDGSHPASLFRLCKSRNNSDQPALGFELQAGNEAQLRAFVEEHLGDEVNLVIGTEILTRFKITESLRTGGMIAAKTPGFRPDEIEFLLAILKAKRFPLRMRLLSVERSSD